MDAAHLLAFNRALIAAFPSPGPAMPDALRNTLKGGLAAGVATGYLRARTWIDRIAALVLGALGLSLPATLPVDPVRTGGAP